jgi:uncharacterized protein (DUF1778 family)
VYTSIWPKGRAPWNLANCRWLFGGYAQNPNGESALDKLTNTDKRNMAIRVRYTFDERQAIVAKATEAGLTTSEFVRHAALGAPIKVVRLERLHPADLKQIKRLGNLMNQIARAIHRGRFLKGTLSHLDEVLDETQSLILHQLRKWGDNS